MLNIDLYIHSTGRIAPAAVKDEPVTKLLCAEPDYSSYINPMQLRRMSKAVRMGIGASRECMQQAGIEKPDALSIGTAMGCLQDTEFFLSKMVTQEEKMLTPTAFIQSTHNTVGGQIALLAGCHGHNMTFVHRGHSFEHAVINTKLYLQDHPGETVLTGAIDELTPGSHDLMQKAGFYTNDPVVSDDFSKGNIAGEGASFFTINEEEAGSICRIAGLELIITGKHELALEALQSFLKEQSITGADIDLVISGVSGDKAATPFYANLRTLFDACPVSSFKQECGEYATASAFALSIVTNAFKDGSLPLPNHQPVQLNRVLLVNNYCDHYSYWLLERN